jgi:hypothetical protein
LLGFLRSFAGIRVDRHCARRSEDGDDAIEEIDSVGAQPQNRARVSANSRALANNGTLADNSAPANNAGARKTPDASAAIAAARPSHRFSNARPHRGHRSRTR